MLFLILNAYMNQQPLIPTCVQLRQGHMTTTCTCMHDHHAHSIHLAPRGLHSSVQVPQSQSKVRQTHKDNEDMKSLSFQTCSYSSRQVVRNERQNEQFLRRWYAGGLAGIQQVRVTKLLITRKATSCLTAIDQCLYAIHKNNTRQCYYTQYMYMYD